MHDGNQMIKFKILMPCYNDWSSVFKLLNNIDKEVSNIKGEFSIIIVNDGSTEKAPELTSPLKNIKSVNIIHIKNNQGHTRSNATGIKYCSKKLDFDYLILMDGDGEDRPEEIKLLVKKVLDEKDVSVVARRTKRSEGIIFTIFYNLHKLITLIFTGRNMNFGHYSCVTKRDLITISSKKSLWGCYSGTLKKFVSKLNNIPCIRGKRYVQPSKMSFIKLVIHAFSILAVFKNQVLIRSSIFLLILFLFVQNLYGVLLGFLIVSFTTCVFLISKRENIEELTNCENKIDNIDTIHTKRL
tara:strand:- start:38 stop:931 length:894 start_codon:yes stop_codon:yes gene_type:complete